VERTQANPIFAQLHEMKQRMDQLFTESFKAGKRGSDTPETAEQSRPWEPWTDIWESEDSWRLIMDLPGVAYEDLQVELAENRLTVKGTRKPLPGHEGMEAAQLERSQGAFSRTFVLSGSIREETIKAELRQGELTVVIAKESGSQVTQQRVRVRAG
jgi:HSP20 family protein